MVVSLGRGIREAEPAAIRERAGSGTLGRGSFGRHNEEKHNQRPQFFKKRVFVAARKVSPTPGVCTGTGV